MYFVTQLFSFTVCHKQKKIGCLIWVNVFSDKNILIWGIRAVSFRKKHRVKAGTAFIETVLSGDLCITFLKTNSVPTSAKKVTGCD